MLVNSKKLLIKAKENKKAVGAFNFSTLEQLKAIVNACKKCNAGCILSTSEGAIKFIGIKNIVSMVKNEVEELDIEFALHLDHGKSFETCKLAIDSGYTSVMIDASNLSFEKNVKTTLQVVEYAKKYNVSVEAELGKLQGIEDNVSSMESVLTSPLEASDFIEKTGIDSLAISIGTSHGAYKFKGESKLHIDRLKEINKITKHFPLVLHGASSVNKDLVSKFNLSGGKIENAKGVDDNSIVSAIENGICKINVDTDLRISFTTGVRESLKNKEVFDLRTYLSNGIKFMEEEVINRIKLFNLQI